MSPACAPPSSGQRGASVPLCPAASCRSFGKFVLRKALGLFADPLELPKLRHKVVKTLETLWKGWLVLARGRHAGLASGAALGAVLVCTGLYWWDQCGMK